MDSFFRGRGFVVVACLDLFGSCNFFLKSNIVAIIVVVAIVVAIVAIGID